MRVIGTAGHVDHGKSTLIEALTGINPDRLKEERERQMTIDLGFAWMDLPSGEPVGIVDVPGHRDFIGNMLAGVGGIDAALFVVAVDEGVMPQTREHLAILDILQIGGGVVALTKIDLIEELDWIDLVEEDVRDVLRGTALENVPIVRVSSQNGQGLPELREKLDELLTEKPPRQDLGRPRLPVDRVFSIAGFGTVVTGTLRDGKLQVGEDVEILPQVLHGRIRGLQTHKQMEDFAVPGSRTAINISGVSTDQIQRGDVVTHVGDYSSTRRLDVRFRLLPSASGPLKHNIEVKLFIGSAEVLARVRTLGIDQLSPGEDGWLQLETRDPVVVARGDHYILRRPSPGETIGGGVVVDPNPKGRHKRFASGLIERLESLAEGTPADILEQSLATLGAAPIREATIQSNLEQKDAQNAFEELIRRDALVILEEEKGELSAQSDILVSSSRYWEQLTAETLHEVDNYHISHPLRRGMPKEELKSRLDVSPRLFSSLIRILTKGDRLREVGPLISSPDHEIKFSPQQEQAVQLMGDRFGSSPYSPPSIKDTKAELGEDVYEAMVELDLLVPVSAEVVFRREDYDRMVGEVKDLFRSQGTLSAAQVRDHFNTSRRYVLALLEHLDEIGLTIREGDVRRLRKDHQAQDR
jgi:selenocysteine-specific elongation factor